MNILSEDDIDDLVLDCGISLAIALEIHEFNMPVCLEAHHYLLAHLSQ